MATSPVRATYVSPSGTPYTASGVDQKSAIATATANALKDSANSGAIPASTLSSADKPATVTPPAPTTNATSMAGLLDATANQNKDSYQANLDAKAKTAEKGADTSFQAYLDSILGTEGKTSLTAKEYAATGVDQAQSDLNDITNQILAEQTASRHAQEQVLRNNPNGLGAEVLQAKADQINRDSVSKQADLAVIQLAKQGKYDSAKAIADRAVEAKFEQQKIVNDALQLNYERNKDLFTTAEQRAFETAQADRTRKLDFVMYQEKAKFDQIIQQSDPLYKLQLAKAQKEVSLLGEPTAAEKKANEAALKEAKAAIPVMQDKIAAVDALKQSGGIASRVGTTDFITRGGLGGVYADLTGQGQDFAGGVHKLVGGLTLQSLIDAKARGATFGALSEGELNILASSATAINDWEIKDKNGKGTGYWNIDATSFNKELDTIKTLTQRALQASGESVLSSDEQSTLDDVYNSATSSPGSYYNP